MKNQKPPEPENIKFNKHWGSLAKGYLALAEQGFLYFKNQGNIGKKDNQNSKKLFELEKGCMIVASIWNIKHGIELLIKGLGINLEKKYWHSHDIDFLIKDIEKKFGDYCVKKHLLILQNLVKKYYNCEFSEKTAYMDKNNEYFKYFETKNDSLNYSFVHDLDKEDIKQFLRDIHNLKRVYDVLEGQYKHFKISVEKFGMNRNEVEKELLEVPTMKNPGFK